MPVEIWLLIAASQKYKRYDWLFLMDGSEKPNVNVQLAGTHRVRMFMKIVGKLLSHGATLRAMLQAIVVAKMTPGFSFVI